METLNNQNMTTKEKLDLLIKANTAYRIGNPIITDQEYDLIVSEIKDTKEYSQLLTIRANELVTGYYYPLQ